MTEQQRFVKKPVEISATQWFRNGDHPLDHHPMDTKNPTDEDRKRYDDYLATEGKVVRYYRHPEVSGKATCQKCGNVMHRHGWIDTLEGGHIVCPGDWIITGVQGEHYPCKPDIFEATYQPAGDQHPDDAAEDRFATAPAGELRPDCSVCGDFGSDCDVCGTPYQQPVSDPDGKSKQAALQDEAGFTPQRLMESAPNGCWGQSEYVLRNYVDGILHSVDIGGHRFVLKQASPDPDERDRAVAGEQADRCIGAIDGMLDERKPWYSAQEMYDFLIRRDYSAQIASELSELWADSLNSARQRVLTENAPDEREIAAKAIEQTTREYFSDESGPHNLHDYLLWRAKRLRAGKEGEPS